MRKDFLKLYIRCYYMSMYFKPLVIDGQVTVEHIQVCMISFPLGHA